MEKQILNCETNKISMREKFSFGHGFLDDGRNNKNNLALESCIRYK